MNTLRTLLTAVAPPRLQLITASELEDFWLSDHYGTLSKCVLSRAAFMMEKPKTRRKSAHT